MKQRTSKARCGAKTVKDAQNFSPHVCKRFKGHKGKHRCGLQKDIAGKWICHYEWPQARKRV
jgi:hypothetical protein